MAPDEHELLRRSIALGEENNQILRRIERHIRLQRLMTWIYWLIIIGLSFGAYYLIQPYIHAITGASGSSYIDNFVKNFNQTK